MEREVIIDRVEGRMSPRMAVSDSVAIEEPLEIRVGFGDIGNRTQKSLSITMRTPGQDADLALGFLFSEGVLDSYQTVDRVSPCGPPNALGIINTIKVELTANTIVDLERLKRHFYTTSSCGVCGKASLEALKVTLPPPPNPNEPVFSPQFVHELPDRLRSHQTVFDHTGAIHAAALFSREGNCLAVREDVGRHNAVDKLVGWALNQDLLPLSHSLLFVSGRASFELVQKAARAGVSVFAAVGAPSSLAVELAREQGMTLLGFVRNQRFNVYCGGARIAEGDFI